MSEEKYVDPNSGAAPQPGGWVGPHGVELGYAAPAQEAQVEVPSQDAQMGVPVEGEESEAFDPGDHTVDEVLAYMDENPDQKDAVLKAEKAGKGRKGVTGE